MNKIDILLLFGGALFIALSMGGYKDQSDTLAIQPSTNIAVAVDNQTIRNILEGIEHQTVGAIGMIKPRRAAPPMPKSYPIRSPPKPSPKPKPKKK